MALMEPTPPSLRTDFKGVLKADIITDLINTQDARNAWIGRADRLQNRIDKLIENEAKLQKEVDHLTEYYSNHTSRISAQEDLIIEMRKQLNVLHEDNEMQRRERDEANQTIRDRDAKIRELQHRLNNDNGKISGMIMAIEAANRS